MIDDLSPEPEPGAALEPPRRYPPTAIGLATPPPPSRAFSILRIAAFITIVVGAVGSVALMLRTGRRMPPILVVLIGLWVVSPFALLAFGEVLSKRWSPAARATLHTLALVCPAVSLAIYQAVAFGPPRPKPAFFFVLVPPVSWLLIATGVGAVALVSRKRSMRSA